jgi:hypothetical protein
LHDTSSTKSPQPFAADKMPGAMDTSYLTTQVNTIIGQLHTIWDEIGIPRNERESRETEVGHIVITGSAID